MSPVNRWLLKWSRLLHLFLSMFGLVVLLFFTLTGLMLNHEDWFKYYEYEPRVDKGTINQSYLSQPDKLMVVEALRADFGAMGSVTNFDATDDALDIEFKGAGRKSSAHIDRQTGQVEVTHEMGLLGRLADAHRARYSGPVWSLLIDATCVLLLFICATGVILWLPLHTRRQLGFIAFCLGSALFFIAYCWFMD